MGRLAEAWQERRVADRTERERHVALRYISDARAHLDEARGQLRRNNDQWLIHYVETALGLLRRAELQLEDTDGRRDEQRPAGG